MFNRRNYYTKSLRIHDGRYKECYDGRVKIVLFMIFVEKYRRVGLLKILIPKRCVKIPYVPPY